MTDRSQQTNFTDFSANILDKQKIVDLVKEVVVVYYNAQNFKWFDKTRERDYVKIRQVTMYVVKMVAPKIPLEYIGATVCGQDHSTVIHACKKIKDQLEVDRYLKKEINEITDILRARHENGDFAKNLNKDVFYLDMANITTVTINHNSGVVFTGISEAIVKEITEKYFNKPIIKVNKFNKTGLFILQKLDNTGANTH